MKGVAVVVVGGWTWKTMMIRPVVLVGGVAQTKHKLLELHGRITNMPLSSDYGHDII